MPSTRSPIPNPNKISNEEKEFLNASSSSQFLSQNNIIDKPHAKKEKPKVSLYSTPLFFTQMLDEYLAKNPSEGSKSSFVVRVVSEYIKSKT